MSTHFGLELIWPKSAWAGAVTCRRFARSATTLGAWLKGSSFRLGVGTLSRTGCVSFESALEASMSTVTLVNLSNKGSNLAVVITTSAMLEPAQAVKTVLYFSLLSLV